MRKFKISILVFAEEMEWTLEMDNALLNLIQKQEAWEDTMSILGGNPFFKPNKISKLAHMDDLGKPLRWADPAW